MYALGQRDRFQSCPPFLWALLAPGPFCFGLGSGLWHFWIQFLVNIPGVGEVFLISWPSQSCLLMTPSPWGYVCSSYPWWELTPGIHLVAELDASNMN